MEPVVDILERFLGEPQRHDESKMQVSFDCPECSEQKGMPHGDGKGNLEVNYSKGVFKCWACNQSNDMHGSIRKLIKIYGTGKDIKDFDDLKEFFEINQYQAVDSDDPKKKKKKVNSLPKEYMPLSTYPKDTVEYNKAMSYLKNRNITDDIIEEFNIGFALKGKYAGRIIIPCYDRKGKINYFVSRAYDGRTPKYLNPEADRSEIIPNEYRVNYDSTIYLVEGVFDHIVVPNSIPLLGVDMSDKLFDALQEKAASYVVICLDSEAYNESVELYNKLNTHNLYNRVKVVKTKTKHDPSKIHELLGRKGIIKLLKNSTKLNKILV